MDKGKDILFRSVCRFQGEVRVLHELNRSKGVLMTEEERGRTFFLLTSKLQEGKK